MYPVIKNTLLATVTTGLFALVTHSGSKKALPAIPEKTDSGTRNPFVLAVDSPAPVSNQDLHYPISDNQPGEPIYNSTQPLQLNGASNIQTNTTYDPDEKNFNFTQKIGTMDYRPPIYMTQDEYQDYLFKKQTKGYWKSKVQADAKSDPAKTRLIPQLNVKNELFDRIFGGSTVDIRPTGSAELIFGFITNRNQNPAIPVKQRKITNFDFNMKIQINLVGKIGEKVKLTTNYNTEASFDFENQMKIEYNGLEDEIIKKVEAGNVNLPLNNSLITGSQTLFGVKTTMQFGKLTATSLVSQERGKKTEITVQSGTQTIPYMVTADNYEANRHYFLSQFFRDNYSSWINVPIVTSPIQITKIEVYATNRTNQTDQARNIAAFADLGEDTSHVYYDNKNNPIFKIINDSTGLQPRNFKNNLYQFLVDSPGYNSSGGLGPLHNHVYDTAVKSLEHYSYINNQGQQEQVFNAGREYEILARARRLNPTTDYILNYRLGYISLNSSLNYDEVLAVAFQYTYNGIVYQVGEFSDQYPTNDKLLILKMLKSTMLNTRIPMWNLMMKNVYSLGAYSVSPTNFQLNVLYNNIKTGVDIPYIPYGKENGRLLIQLMGLDKVNMNSDPHPDGYYDFIPNITINPQNGRVYFTTVEPFGSDLKSRFDQGEISNSWSAVNNFIFQELYDSTRISAQQLPQKNRYKLKGTYQSATSNEFSLSSMNIPQGSVRVTAGGVILQENTDYTVDYTLGRVKIINESILNSGQTIKISCENNSMFNIQQKSLIGERLDYKVNKDFSLGSTLLHMTERPLTQKVNAGDEPVSNTVAGFDYNYRHNAPWLTRLVDKIPGIATKEPSSISVQGEAAKLFPGHSKAIQNNSYVDDFEGSISLIDMRSPISWFHASIPQGQPTLFPETALGFADSTIAGINRANLNWYTIDQSVFYQQIGGLTPGNITTKVQSNHFMEPYFESDLFPKKMPPNNQPVLLPMLDLAYYPSERGIYNFDTRGLNGISAGINVAATNNASTNPHGYVVLNDPSSRWGGIMRRVETNDFQATNVEYIQFWMMDPFNTDYNNTSQAQYNTFGVAPPTGGELYLDLGSVSEDILQDGNMAYENGIPPSGSTTPPSQVMGSTPWGRYPTSQPIVNAFDLTDASRPLQDVGYDCLKDYDNTPGSNDETRKFAYYVNDLHAMGINNTEAYNDPAGDNYHFYRGDDYDNISAANTLFRYKKYNNVEGNSMTQSEYQNLNGGHYPTTATTLPNIEDVNRDNTMNQSEAYYQYHLKITPQDVNINNIGNNYLVNYIPVTKAGPDGVSRTVNFFQFKIPITNFDSKVGTIEGYNSIRFMRMFVKNFNNPVIMRFARLELVRNDWRNYLQDLALPNNQLGTDDPTFFNVSGVSYQENGTRTPINYVLPPGINQQQNVQTTNLVLMNEQSLSMQVCGLKNGDARAIYKSVNMDVRSYGKLKMFVHAEKLNNQPLNNNDVHLFMRFGSDFTNNYYEYELPLQLTGPGTYDNNSDGDRTKVWPTANDVEVVFATMSGLKLKRNAMNPGSIGVFEETDGSGHVLRVVGNPNIATLTNIMIGIKNPVNYTNPADKCVEVWIDEMRLTDFDQKGGWAANSSMKAKLADFGMIAVSGSISTPFYGSIESKPSARSRELTEQYDASGTFQLAKFLPKDWKLNIPMFVQYGEIFVTPQYDPSNPDVLMSNVNKQNGFTDGSKGSVDQIGIIKNRAIDYTRRRGINFMNVSKQRGKNKTKIHPWDVENLSVSYAYNEQYKHNITTAWSFMQQTNFSLNYNYQNQMKPWEPFKKSKSTLLQSPWMKLIKEANILPMPNQFNFATTINRNYVEVLNRDITSLTSSFTQTQFNKTFLTSRVYTVQWNLTKNIKYDFSANNDGRILEPNYGKIQTEADKQFISNNIMKGGLNTAYKHTSNLNVTLPINKIPALDFISSATYKYSTSYNWQRRAFATPTVGNTISNNQVQTANVAFNMVNLYNKIPYFKRINLGLLKKDQNNSNSGKGKSNATGTSKPKIDPKTGKPIKDTTKKDPPEIFEYLARVLMTLKSGSITFNQTQGTTLPGYNDSTRVMGMDPSNNLAPGPGFVMGQQNGILNEVMNPNNNLLKKIQNFSNPYAHTFMQAYSYMAKIEPFKNFKIDVVGSRSYGLNETYFIGYDSARKTFHPITTQQTGQFSISVLTIGSAFSAVNPITHNSNAFDHFRTDRANYSTLLSKQNAASNKSIIGDGYGHNQQDVIILSFLDAYAGKHSKSIDANTMFPKLPMPNWTVTYDGLGKINMFKKIFKSLVVTHGYHSTMNLAGFTNNQAFGVGSVGNSFMGSNRVDTTVGANFVSKYLMNSITISEQFSPLIKFNMTFVDKGKFKGLGANIEWRKDKTTTLSANIPQVTEIHSNEINVGANYTYPNLIINRFKIQGKPLKSDLQVSLTFSARQNNMAIHKINTDETGSEYQFSQLVNGSNIYSIKSSITYVLTKNINLRLFYDRTINTPVISTSFPTQTTNAGVSLRFVIQ